MGQNAVMVHIDRNGTTRMTTIQWSSELDQNLSDTFVRIEDRSKRRERVRELFATITATFEHVGSIEPDIDYRYGTKTPVLDTLLYVYDGRLRGVSETDICATLRGRNTDCDYTNIVDGLIDGNSVGAIYDERHPEVVTFAWLNLNDMPDFESLDIDDFMTDGYCFGYHNAMVARNRQLRSMAVAR